MNAVEIEQAISELAEKPFDRKEFPFQFLEAFGNKETALKRLRTGVSNKSDLGGRGGSVDLNRFRAFSKWFSASVMPPPLRVS